MTPVASSPLPRSHAPLTGGAAFSQGRKRPPDAGAGVDRAGTPRYLLETAGSGSPGTPHAPAAAHRDGAQPQSAAAAAGTALGAAAPHGARPGGNTVLTAALGHPGPAGPQRPRRSGASVKHAAPSSGRPRRQ